MKSATLLSGEKCEPYESKPRQSDNAKKIARLLKKRRELLEKEKLKLESDERNNKIKESQKEMKDLNQRSEPTSEDEDDEPETITENSDSYDSNDEFRVKVISKDLDKGWRLFKQRIRQNMLLFINQKRTKLIFSTVRLARLCYLRQYPILMCPKFWLNES